MQEPSRQPSVTAVTPTPLPPESAALSCWPEERILEALLHPSELVRVMALNYFTGSFSRNAGVMLRVIEWVKQYEDPDRTELPADVENLVQTDGTLGWCIEELERSNRASIWRIEHRVRLCSLIAGGETRFLSGQRDRIGAIPAFMSSYLDLIDRRLEAGSLDDNELWRRLGTSCAAVAAGDEKAELERQAIVEAIGERGGMVDRASAFAAEHLPGVEFTGPQAFTLSAIELAGTFGAGEFCEEILESLRAGAHPIRQAAAMALAKIGSARALPAVLKRMDDASPGFRMAASEVLSRMRSGEAAAASLRLADREAAVENRSNFLFGALSNFAAEAIEPARDHVLQFSDQLRAPLVGVAIAREASFAELSRWKLEEERLAKKRRWSEEPGRPEVDAGPAGPEAPRVSMLAAPREPLKATKPAGRNDPCPCGSGKKYKKCCLAKDGGD